MFVKIIFKLNIIFFLIMQTINIYQFSFVITFIYIIISLCILIYIHRTFLKSPINSRGQNIEVDILLVKAYLYSFKQFKFGLDNGY